MHTRTHGANFSVFSDQSAMKLWFKRGVRVRYRDLVFIFHFDADRVFIVFCAALRRRFASWSLCQWLSEWFLSDTSVSCRPFSAMQSWMIIKSQKQPLATRRNYYPVISDWVEGRRDEWCLFKLDSSTTDAAWCYRRSRMVCLSISVCPHREPCKNGRTNRDAVWVVDSGGPKEACIRWVVHVDVTWRIRLNHPCCGGNAALCQITLTTCYSLIKFYVQNCVRG